MELVTLYRVGLGTVEQGPFVRGASVSLDDHCQQYKSALHYPSPYNDSKIERDCKEEESCACTSVSQLKYWFLEDRAMDVLLSMNARIYVLEVPKEHVVRGELQALYIRAHAKVVLVLPIEALPTLGEDHEQASI